VLNNTSLYAASTLDKKLMLNNLKIQRQKVNTRPKASTLIKHIYLVTNASLKAGSALKFANGPSKPIKI